MVVLWVIRCMAGETPMYRTKAQAVGKKRYFGHAWTTNLDNADIYTDDELPPGQWEKVNVDDLVEKP